MECTPRHPTSGLCPDCGYEVLPIRVRRVFERGEAAIARRSCISHDVRAVTLSDGRLVMLTGMEWMADATPEQRMERARMIAYDEERKR